MNAKRCVWLMFGVLALVHLVSSGVAHACGHDGFYAGVGYNQLFMFTPEHRLSVTSSRRVNFGPGYGANALIGYDFCGSRWGIQLPFEFSRLKLNNSEWVNQYTTSVEGVLHLVEWQNGIDIHLLGGAGWSYLSEGSIDDRTASIGITASFGPGLSYYFSRTETVSASITFEAPFRWIYYIGDHLSSGGTSVMAIPLRLSLQVGF